MDDLTISELVIFFSINIVFPVALSVFIGGKEPHRFDSVKRTG